MTQSLFHKKVKLHGLFSFIGMLTQCLLVSHVYNIPMDYQLFMQGLNIFNRPLRHDMDFNYGVLAKL